ncbi:hypothetical protein ABZT04_31100 [Streptomyces sp. NPDC005492]|uniref:hypothetical protein n=1 Tax=Streptomyces sp. NPDC005492 TaxID=3156883 RepID=UPI0033A9C7F2
MPDTVKDKAAVAAEQVKATAPEPVRNHRTALISAGAAFLAVFVLLRRKKK